MASRQTWRETRESSSNVTFLVHIAQNCPHCGKTKWPATAISFLNLGVFFVIITQLWRRVSLKVHSHPLSLPSDMVQWFSFHHRPWWLTRGLSQNTPNKVVHKEVQKVWFIDNIKITTFRSLTFIE